LQETRYKDLFPKFSATKAPTSPLRCPQRVGFLSTLKPPSNDHKDQVRLFTINLHEEDGNTNFLGLNHTLGSFQATPSHLRDESPRVTNAIKVVDEDVEVLLLGIKWLTQRLATIFSLKLKDE
jgi:hypothetical protein